MLCLHLSVAGPRGSTASWAPPARDTGERTAAAAAGRVSSPPRSAAEPAERPETPGAAREPAPMRREGDSRRSNAGGAGARAGERGDSSAEFSGYETAAGSDIYQSFSDSDSDQVGSFGAQPGRKDGGARLEGSSGGGESGCTEIWADLAAEGSDEVHFITTHQIQLYELDHDGDCDGAAYSFLDSSSPESDASEEGSLTPRASAGEAPAAPGAAPGRESAGDEGARRAGAAGGHVRLSIRASSRAVGEERAARPGARGAEASRCSSGAVSELDEADQEVRSLTARSFRSLARLGDEYLDTDCSGNRSTDLSSLSGGSVGCSRWAEGVGAHCRKSMGKADCGEFPAQAANGSVSAPGEDPRSPEGGPGELPPEGEGSQPASAAQDNPAGRGGESAQLGSRVTAPGQTVPEGQRHPPRGSGPGDGLTDPPAAGGGAGMAKPQRKSQRASSLLQNIIWKRMQFEQELRMERGEISDTSSPGRGSNSPPGPEQGHSARGSLFPSQRSAFRAWPDAGANSARAGQSIRAEIAQSPGRDTKMSHLFVPGIQRAPTGTEPRKASPRDHPPPPKGAAEGDSAAVRSPEIRIKVRSRRSPGPGPVPEVRCQPLMLAEAGHEEGGRSRAQQHFTVRDIRDNIQRLQAPLHRVRDVRKLLKSSYHIVTVHGGTVSREERVPPAPTLASSPSVPIVIKCQAVSKKQLPGNWKSGARASGGGGSLENAVNDSTLPQAARPGSPDTAMITGSRSVPRASLPVTGAGRAAASPPTSGAAAPGLDKALGAGCQAEASKRLALEKLTAAVKSMEQLYVFDRNEWKRKSEAVPGAGALAGSHVLSLIASEEASGSDREAPAGTQPPDPTRKTEPSTTPGIPKTPGAAAKCTVPQLFTVAPVSQAPARREFKPAATVRSPPVQPEVRSVRAPLRPSLEESEKAAQNVADARSGPPAEFENYLTIPIKQPPAPEPPTTYSAIPGRLHSPSPKQQREPSPATIYHQPPSQKPNPSPALVVQPPELISHAKLVESPPVPCFPGPHTQRKMLLDPTTGQYYLVDTPLQPARKRLYDPETGQYVDVPIPQQPLTPMSVPMSPIAINPGAYGTTYMLYPGFLPTPALLPPLQSQLARADSERNETVKPPSAISQPGEAQYMESPYYFPTGKSMNPTHTVTSQHITRASKGFPEGKPVISITSQPGPRIIAPPSFDGTTMSFIVEHR
ncbi:uncharacterized protein C4orf54-like [Hemiscyllium ocellatum]|uniref:uncharacterized protein C4orf54-like n=1 Tax=Hemiscyllium ocellatum TaxID=170820 RepID=UPI0029665AC0|nr:uncharacterized protein C4orf54-like [Hemiscyllium ocellatum]